MKNLLEFGKIVEETNIKFLNSLKRNNKSHSFFPALDGNTEFGKKLNLGFSCYGLKTFYILNYWDLLNNEEQQNWSNHIKSYQRKTADINSNFFEDSEYTNAFYDVNNTNQIKELAKKIINKSGINKYQLLDEKYNNSIRAETKQSIATLYQVNEKPVSVFSEFQNDEYTIEKFIESLDWSKPWGAGGQFSALCVFAKINNYDHHILALSKFADKIVNIQNGAYYIGSTPNKTEIINGCMKMITGFDWINYEIHYPEKLIDMCLDIKVNNEGCDLVDIVYVLYKCAEVTDYKKLEIESYYLDIFEKIQNHFHFSNNGFSYYLNKSQTEYYGVKISNGLNVPDIHGNLLLVWALSMILKTIYPDTFDWKILKP